MTTQLLDWLAGFVVGACFTLILWFVSLWWHLRCVYSSSTIKKTGERRKTK